MEKILLHSRTLAASFLLLCLFFINNTIAQTTITSGNTVSASTITAGTTVIINAGGTLNMDVSRSFTTITTANAGTSTISGSGTLTVSGANGVGIVPGNTLSLNTICNTTILRSTTNGATAVISGTGTLNASGNVVINKSNGNNSGTIEIDSGVTVNAAQVEHGSGNNGTWNIIVDGTLGISGATFNSGTLSTVTLSTGSTVNYRGTGAQTIAAYSYYNLMVSGARAGNDVTFAAATNIAGDLTVSATGNSGSQLILNSSGTARTFTIGGDYIQTGYEVQLGTNAISTINLTGDFSKTGGYIITDAVAGNGIINFVGTTQNARCNGGAVIKWVNFNVTSGSACTFNGSFELSGTSGNPGVFTVNSGGILNSAANIISGTSFSTFTLASGGTLIIGSSVGITTAGNATGNVQTVARNFNAAGNYVYNGSGAQAAGNGLPATIGSLSITNSTVLTLPSVKAITNNFSVAAGSSANLGTFSHTAGTLTLGGFGTPLGSHGSTSSSATNKNNTFFAATSGIVTVGTGTCAAISAVLSASPTTICSGSNTNLSVVITGGLTPYNVVSSAGTVNPYTSGNNIAISPLSTTTYSLTSVKDTNGCTAASLSGTPTVTVHTASVAPTSISGTASICAGSSTTLTVSGGTAGVGATVEWFSGSCGGTSAGTGNSIVVSPGTTTTYYVRYTNTCNTTTCASQVVTFNPIVASSVSIAASPSSTICAGTNVTFTATPTNGGGSPSYQWKLNGSNVGTNSATYSNNGLANGNTVTVQMTSNATCVTGSPATSNTVTMTVNPNVAASVSIVASPSSTICAGTNVTFTATPTNGGGSPSYQWKLNGSNVGSNSATYSNNGLSNGNTVTVEMTSNATCATGSPATSNTVTMTVNPNVAASVSIAASPSSTICAGTNVTFTATPTNGGGSPSYQWKLNGSNVGSNSATYSNNGLTNGNTVTVQMTSNATCATGSPATSNTVTMTVNPNVAASVSIAASPSSTICAGTNVTFTATPTNGGGSPSYQWKLNGSNVGSNSATYSNNGLANGNTVTVQMTSNATCATGSPATSNTVTMTVNPNVAASVSIAASPSSTICAGTNVTFTATPTNGGGSPSYQWKLNGSNVGSNSATYSNNGLANGNTVTVQMTSNATCATGSPATSNTVTMTVNTGSTIASISGSTSICSASSTNLQVAITGGVSPYTLVYSGGTINNYVSNVNIPVSPLSTTGYTITSVTDANGCVGTGNSGTATVTIGALTSSSDGVTWTNGAPTSGTNAILTGAGTINIGANLNACSLTVNGPTVTVTSGFNVDLNGALTVTSGSFTLNNNANLIQHNSNYTNSGNITVKRNSAALNRLDYTLWSTPVTGQGLYAFSKTTLPNRFYVYNSANDQFSNAVGFNLTGLQYPSPLVSPNGINGTDTNNIQFANGKGYLIRLPWDHPTAPTVWTGSFTGVPNNGNITISSLTNGSYYATGNPYPSTIDADQFIIDNNIGDTATPGDGLYFWRKTNNASAASYATYTTAGGVPSGGDTLNIQPSGVIQVGEGFIVKTTSTSLGFNNGQRIADNGNQMLRTNTTIERNRIWLKLSNGTANINQMMVSYMTGATQGIDVSIDGRFFKDSPTALNSLLDNEEFAIQGRSLPFESSDIVPLAFKAETAGSFTIAVDHVDGLFTGGAQAIYLKDNLTTTIHNLNTAYTFATAAGTFNNRFELVYQPELANPVFTANTVIIYSQGNGFVVNSGNFVMSSIKVFDIRGRLIEEKKAINASQATINGGLANEVLLVQITTEDGVMVTKKVIK